MAIFNSYFNSSDEFTVKSSVRVAPNTPATVWVIHCIKDRDQMTHINPQKEPSFTYELEQPYPFSHGFSPGFSHGFSPGFSIFILFSHGFYQWEFQDPKMEVLYHIRPYFAGMFPYIGLKNRPKIYGIGKYLQSIGSWPAWPFIRGYIIIYPTKSH